VATFKAAAGALDKLEASRIQTDLRRLLRRAEALYESGDRETAAKTLGGLASTATALKASLRPTMVTAVVRAVIIDLDQHSIPLDQARIKYEGSQACENGACVHSPGSWCTVGDTGCAGGKGNPPR
jgi:hypothetical protein